MTGNQRTNCTVFSAVSNVFLSDGYGGCAGGPAVAPFHPRSLLFPVRGPIARLRVLRALRGASLSVSHPCLSVSCGCSRGCAWERADAPHHAGPTRRSCPPPLSGNGKLRAVRSADAWRAGLARARRRQPIIAQCLRSRYCPPQRFRPNHCADSLPGVMEALACRNGRRAVNLTMSTTPSQNDALANLCGRT